jgi:signal transduction histidine kinase
LVACADAPFTVTYVDVAALRTLGRERDAVLGAALFDVLEAHELDTMLDSAIANGEACHVRMPRPARDGARCERRFTLTPLPLRGPDHHTLVTIEDYVLGADPDGNTHDVTAIIDLVSHELRSPLNSALTWTSLLEVDRTPKTVDRAVEVIRQSIQEQARLIEDLVDVGRTGRPRDLDVETLDLTALVQETMDAARGRLQQHTTLTYTPPPHPCEIVGDAGRLRRAVRHMVDNAQKFMSMGGAIDAQLRTVNGSAQLEVRDHGIGLTADEIARTFTPFWRAQPKLRGGGLGLGVIHAVVSRHGGTVCARSAGTNQGSVFTIMLPLDREGA